MAIQEEIKSLFLDTGIWVIFKRERMNHSMDVFLL